MVTAAQCLDSLIINWRPSLLDPPRQQAEGYRALKKGTTPKSEQRP